MRFASLLYYWVSLYTKKKARQTAGFFLWLGCPRAPLRARSARKGFAYPAQSSARLRGDGKRGYFRCKRIPLHPKFSKARQAAYIVSKNPKFNFRRTEAFLVAKGNIPQAEPESSPKPSAERRLGFFLYILTKVCYNKPRKAVEI